MNDIYVYNNPGNIAFNSYLYAFVRAWYTLDGSNDLWLKVPALNSGGSILCINSNIESIALLLLADDGTVLKSHSSQLRQPKVVDAATLQSIDNSALNVSEWEKQHQEPFPFAEMFDNDKVRERYKQKFGHDKPNYDQIADVNYRQVKRIVTPPARCGSCGKRR